MKIACSFLTRFSLCLLPCAVAVDGSAWAQSGGTQGVEPSQQASAELQVACDPRVELMSIVMRIAGAQEYNMANASSPYSAEVDAWFGPYKNHPAIISLQEMRRSYGISYDAPMSLAVHLKDIVSLDELIPFDAQPQRLDARWKLKETRAFLVLLEDFVEQSSFREFITKHEAFYTKSAARMRTKLEESSYLPWLAEFFGLPPSARFQAILGLLNGGGSYGSGVVFPDRSEFITPIIGIYSWDEQGLPLFDHNFVSTVVHEFVHSYTNHLVDAHWTFLMPSMQRIFPHCKGLMSLQAYSNPRTVMYESLVRASVRRYMLANATPAAAKTHLQGEVHNGFLWTEDLAELLGSFEQERKKYPDLNAFMPEVVSFFATYATEYDRKMADAPHIVSIVPDPSQPIDPNVSELVITFDRPMQAGSYAITNRGSSPKFGTAVYSADAKTLRIPMKVKAGATYALSLNNMRFRGFKSAEGIALDPYHLDYQVRSR